MISFARFSSKMTLPLSLVIFVAQVLAGGASLSTSTRVARSTTNHDVRNLPNYVAIVSNPAAATSGPFYCLRKVSAYTGN